MMTKLRQYDSWLFFAAFILLGIGVVMVYSTSNYYAWEKFKDGSHFLKKQGFFALIGASGMAMTMMIDYRFWRKIVYPSLFAVLIMMCLVFVPGIGIEALGAKRWINLGFFWFQPSELAKVALVIYLANILVKKRHNIEDFKKGYCPLFLVSAIFIGVVMLQPDFGTAMTFAGLTICLVFIGGAKKSHVFSTAVIALLLGAIAIMAAEYRRDRFLAFLNPWDNSCKEAFQLRQSFLALGNGGVSGVGLGEGKQKLFYLPLAHSDFILSVIGEEMGLVGIMTIVSMFGFLLYRGFLISMKAPDDFGRLLAGGLTMLIATQASINMGVALGLLPTKGLPLPFMSYGGTNLTVSMAAVGILLNISSAAADKSEIFWRNGARIERQRAI